MNLNCNKQGDDIGKLKLCQLGLYTSSLNPFAVSFICKKDNNELVINSTTPILLDINTSRLNQPPVPFACGNGSNDFSTPNKIRYNSTTSVISPGISDVENVETIIGGGVDSYIIGEVEEDISLTPGSHISSCLNGLSPCVNDIITPNISIFWRQQSE